MPVVVFKYGWISLIPQSPVAQLMRGIYAVSAVGLFYLALSDIPLADATALIFVAPILVAILSPIMLREAVGPRRWLAIMLGFGGVLLVVQPGFQEIRMGTLAGLAAGCVFALFSISSRALAQQDPPLLTVVYTALIGGVVLTAGAPMFFVMPVTSDLVFFAAMVVFAGLGQVLLMYAFAAAPAAVVTPFFYVSIISAAGIGYFIYGDFPDLLAWSGISLLIAVGVYFVVRESELKKIL